MTLDFSHPSVALTALAMAVALVTWWLTGRVFRYVTAKAVIDHPNARSSHTTPTPRGGGLAIVAATVGATALATIAGWMTAPVGIALCVGGALVAWVGWEDDKKHVSAGTRALVHALAAVFAVAILRGFPTIRIGASALHAGPLGAVVAVLGIIWAINFYNFMDGIDGIASVEGASVGFFGALIVSAGAAPMLAVPAITIAAACLGFLPWNWSPARLFMGDVGSGFIGYWFAVLAIASENEGGPPALAWVLLLGVFVFDATATLLMRLARRERVFEAHRTHAYQRAVRLGMTHRHVAVVVGVCTAALGALTWWTVIRDVSLVPVLLLAAAALAIPYASLIATTNRQ